MFAAAALDIGAGVERTQHAVLMRVLAALDLNGAVGNVAMGQNMFDFIDNLLGFAYRKAAVYDNMAG